MPLISPRRLALALASAMLVSLAPAAPAVAAVPSGHCAIPSMLSFGVGVTPRSAIFPAGTGTFTNLVIPVDFSDAPAGPSESAAMVAAQVSTAAVLINSNSYGRLNLGAKGGLPWLRMPKTLAYYKTSLNELLPDAIAAAKSANPTIYSGVSVFTVAGSAASDFETRAEIGQKTAPDGTTFAGGVRLGAVSGMTTQGVGELAAHELLHLFGLPDARYKPSGALPPINLENPVWTSSPAAGFDIMSSQNTATPHSMAYMKWKQGWIDDSQVVCAKNPVPVTATLSPLETAGGTKMIAVRTNTARALTVEVRSTVTDGTPGCADGVVVARHDANVMSLAGPIEVIRRSDGYCPSRSTGVGTPYAAAWQSGQAFTDAVTGVHVSVGTKQADGSYSVTVTPPADYGHTVVSTPGIAGYYRLGEPRKASATSTGTWATDAMIDDYTGPAPLGRYTGPIDLREVGAPLNDTNTAVRFQPGSYGTIPDRAPATQFAVEAWAKLDAASTTGGTIIGAPGKVRINVLPGRIAATIWAGGVAYTLDRPSASNSGAWVHVVLRRDGSGIQLIRNGVSLGTLAVPSAATTVVGGTLGAFGATVTPFTGHLDEVATYSWGLPLSYAQSHYAKGIGG